MTGGRREAGSSVRQQFLFWWILFVVFQSSERLFLLRDAAEEELPSLALLVQTFLVGLRGDFIVTTIALVLAALGGIGFAFLRKGAAALGGEGLPFHLAYRRVLRTGGLVLAGTLPL